MVQKISDMEIPTPEWGILLGWPPAPAPFQEDIKASTHQRPYGHTEGGLPRRVVAGDVEAARRLSVARIAPSPSKSGVRIEPIVIFCHLASALLFHGPRTAEQGRTEGRTSVQ